MSDDIFVLSDRHARDRHHAILREVEQMRFADRLASKSPSAARRAVGHLMAMLMVILHR